MTNNLRIARERHPLFNRQIDFTLTWQECREKIDKAVKASDIVEALHNGFDATIIDKDEFRERIFLYLEVANGYDSIYLFSSTAERRDEMLDSIFGRCTVSDAKKKIAQKAWAMLCQKVFRNTEEREYANPSWWWIVKEDSQMIDKILWFFSEKDNIPRGFYVKEHNSRIAVDFLYTLAKLAWINHSDSRGHFEPPLNHFVENRPKFIRILSYLEKLDFLLKNWERVTEDDLAVLEELALFGRNDKDEGPKYKTVEEAAVGGSTSIGGSKSAQVFIVLRAMLKERDHLKKIKEAEREMKKVQEKIEALKG